MHKEFQPATNFNTSEITKLKTTFWGADNSIAETTENSCNYDEVLNLLQETKKKMPLPEGKQFVLDHLGGRRISLGYKDHGKLIAHTGLLVKPWGEIECGGSIIAEDYRGQSLMKELNRKRRVLLNEFSSLGFQLTSYLFLGSRSVDYGGHLFDFPERDLGTYYCNLGPYVYFRPNSISEFDKGLLRDLSLKTSDGTLSTSTQILGIDLKDPPQLSQHLFSHLSKSMQSFISQFPQQNQIAENKEPLKNDLHYSPAKIAVYDMQNPYSEAQILLNEISSHIYDGNNVIMRVPLTSLSEPVLNQINSIVGKEIKGYTMVPTGLGVIHNYWALTYASMKIDRLEHYRKMLSRVEASYSSLLGHLAKYSLEALE